MPPLRHTAPTCRRTTKSNFNVAVVIKKHRGDSGKTPKNGRIFLCSGKGAEMNSGLVYVYDFDRYKNRCTFQHPDGPLVPIKADECGEKKEPQSAEGFPDIGQLKKFWLGRDVLVYHFAGVSYIRVGKKSIELKRGDAVKQLWLGPFCFYWVRCGTIRSFALGLEWFDFVSRIIDPTYDEIDRWAVDFSGCVQGFFERTHRTE